jgi:hypothetical protein
MVSARTEAYWELLRSDSSRRAASTSSAASPLKSEPYAREGMQRWHDRRVEKVLAAFEAKVSGCGTRFGPAALYRKAPEALSVTTFSK